MFEWDEQKRQENLRKHQVDFRKAALIFVSDKECIEARDMRYRYDERRYKAIGSYGGEHFVVAYTWRAENRRIITAWKVGEHGKRRYQEILRRAAEGHGGDG